MMINEIREMRRLCKYALKAKRNIIICLIFLVLGVLMAVGYAVLPGHYYGEFSAINAGEILLLAIPSFFLQMYFPFGLMGVSQTSPLRKKYLITWPMMTMCIWFTIWFIFVTVLRVIQVNRYPEYEMQIAISMILMTVILGILWVYSIVAYRYYWTIVVVLIGCFFVGFFNGLHFNEAKVFGVNAEGLTLGTAVVIGFVLFVIEMLISYFLLTGLYKKPITAKAFRRYLKLS